MSAGTATATTWLPGAEGFLLVRVGDCLCAWPVDQVREVRLPAPLARDSRLPGFVAGALSIRRLLVPVVDLRERWRSDPSRAGAGRIVLARVPPFVVGFIVDDAIRVVRGLARMPPAELAAPNGVDRGSIRGAIALPASSGLEASDALVLVPSEILTGEERAALAALAEDSRVRVPA